MLIFFRIVTIEYREEENYNNEIKSTIASMKILHTSFIILNFNVNFIEIIWTIKLSRHETIEKERSERVISLGIDNAIKLAI